MAGDERALLTMLDERLQSAAARAVIDAAVERVARKLSESQTAVMAWEPIPLSIYGGALPPAIASSWVFILRAGATTGAERHPNSHQRMVSYQGMGDLQTGGEGAWHSHCLMSERHETLEKRWISIPQNVWHQAVVPADGDWVVVSFHTVPAEELIEERPDAAINGPTHRRRYVAS
jgi:hypothetical protein